MRQKQRRHCSVHSQKSTALLLFFPVKDGIWVKSTGHILYLSFYGFHQSVKAAIFRRSNSICLWAPKDSFCVKSFWMEEKQQLRLFSCLLILFSKWVKWQLTQQSVLAWLSALSLGSPSEMLAQPPSLDQLQGQGLGKKLLWPASSTSTFPPPLFIHARV